MQQMDISARRTLYRDPERGVVAGVCAGLAERLGVDPLLPRVVFVAAAAVGGMGVGAYLLAWLLIPAGPTGSATAERLRERPGSGRTAAGVALLTLSGLLALRQLGVLFSDAIVWPVVLGAAGVALVWRLSTPPVDEVAVDARPEVAERAQRRWATMGLYRGGFGVALIVGAALLFLYANGLLVGLRNLALTAVVVTVGLVLILAPFWWRLLRSLAAERAVRIRSQTRAEVAADLHDSVLQTLALIQRRAHDPRAVAALARRQERELRAWLWGSPPLVQDSVASALALAAAEVETERGVTVDVVTVGDAPLDEPARAVVAATREALVNAAKFAGDGPISVYAESGPERLHVFVRDRGPGFDPDAVPPDRHGVRESIMGRMGRQGGRATVRAAQGHGTEIELTLEREQ
jgi:signal transduction histidine kinase/phage shock protein PspC (stress-responsive transcriptional regulator)